MGRGQAQMEMVREVTGDEGGSCRHNEGFGFYSEWRNSMNL